MRIVYSATNSVRIVYSAQKTNKQQKRQPQKKKKKLLISATKQDHENYQATKKKEKTATNSVRIVYSAQTSNINQTDPTSYGHCTSNIDHNGFRSSNF